MSEDGRGGVKDVAEKKKAKQGGFRTMPFILGNWFIPSRLPYFLSSRES
jgi:hypothetical protein